MKNLLASIAMAVLLCSCSIASKTVDGTQEEPTNDLITSQPSNLLLDAIVLKKEIIPYDNLIQVGGTKLEIHIMAQDGETMLACVGSTQKQIMSYLNFGVSYGDINAALVTSNGTDLQDSKNIEIRLVAKGSSSGCPFGYNPATKTADGNSQLPDLVLSKVDTTVGALTAGAVQFDDLATVYFRMELQDAHVFQMPADEVGGHLTLDRIYLSDADFNDDEFSLPEVEVFLAPFGLFQPVACVDLQEVETGSLLYANYAASLKNAIGATVEPETLDDSTAYWLIVSEVDGAKCPAMSAFDEGEANFLAFSQPVSVDNLTGQVIEFQNGKGSLQLYLSE